MNKRPSSYEELISIVQGSSTSCLQPEAQGLWQKSFRVLQKMKSPTLTMSGPESIAFLKEAMDSVLKENIKGDFIETGVWRGGLPLLMRGYLHLQNISDRRVWLADSFEGLPQGWKNIKSPRDWLASLMLGFLDHLSVSEETVKNSFKQYDLLDDQVRILKGWFKDTLPKIPHHVRFGIIRLDGDYYESTMDSLVNLYPKLNPGGYVIIDDYNLPVDCKKAVDEYRAQHKITAPMTSINSQSVYWRKEWRELESSSSIYTHSV